MQRLSQVFLKRRSRTRFANLVRSPRRPRVWEGYGFQLIYYWIASPTTCSYGVWWRASTEDRVRNFLFWHNCLMTGPLITSKKFSKSKVGAKSFGTLTHATSRESCIIGAQASDRSHILVGCVTRHADVSCSPRPLGHCLPSTPIAYVPEGDDYVEAWTVWLELCVVVFQHCAKMRARDLSTASFACLFIFPGGVL